MVRDDEKMEQRRNIWRCEREEQHCCGNCRAHILVYGEWKCCAKDSEYYGDYTGYSDECDAWEGR